MRQSLRSSALSRRLFEGCTGADGGSSGPVITQADRGRASVRWEGLAAGARHRGGCGEGNGRGCGKRSGQA